MTAEPFPRPDLPPARHRRGAGPPAPAVRGAGPADAIATIWYRLGYRPVHSLVLVRLVGASGRLGTMVRADLPARLDAAARRALIGSLFESLHSAAGGRRVIAVVFSDSLLGDTRPVLTGPAVRREIERSGGELMDVIGVTSQRFRSLECRSASCCPREGHPLVLVESSRAAVAHVLAGEQVLPDQAALIADVTAVPEAGVTADPSSGLPARDLLPQWLRALDTGRIDPPGAALLAEALLDPHLRDAVLVAALGAPRAEVIRNWRRIGEVADPAGVGWGALLNPALARRPDTEERSALLERSRQAIAAAARHGRPGSRAPALAALAMLSWYAGRVVRARLLVEAALGDRPGQPMAVVVQALLAEGVRPPWSAEHPV